MPAPTTGQPPAPRKAILIVDDHPMLRRGLASLIATEPDLAVSGEAATRQAALAALAIHPSDLVIVDLALEGGDGLDLLRDLRTRHPGLPALVLSMQDEAVYAGRCLRAGARGYVTKQQLDGTILVAIRQVLAGGIYLSETLQARLAGQFIQGQTLAAFTSVSPLSNRELQVFRQIGQGRTTRQIAERLNLSIKTIETHREHIKDKLNIQTTAELAQRATQWVEHHRPGG